MPQDHLPRAGIALSSVVEHSPGMPGALGSFPSTTEQKQNTPDLGSVLGLLGHRPFEDRHLSNEDSGVLLPRGSGCRGGELVAAHRPIASPITSPGNSRLTSLDSLIISIAVGGSVVSRRGRRRRDFHLAGSATLRLILCPQPSGRWASCPHLPDVGLEPEAEEVKVAAEPVGGTPTWVWRIHCSFPACAFHTGSNLLGQQEDTRVLGAAIFWRIFAKQGTICWARTGSGL